MPPTGALLRVGRNRERQHDENNEVAHDHHLPVGENVVSFDRSQVAGSFTSLGGTLPM